MAAGKIRKFVGYLPTPPQAKSGRLPTSQPVCTREDSSLLAPVGTKGPQMQTDILAGSEVNGRTPVGVGEQHRHVRTDDGVLTDYTTLGTGTNDAAVHARLVRRRLGPLLGRDLRAFRAYWSARCGR